MYLCFIKSKQTMRANTQQLINSIEAAGYFALYSSSKTDFGHSEYIYAGVEAWTPSMMKIRISDHSVTNNDRVFNEYHIPANQQINAEAVITALHFKFKRSEFFFEKDIIVENTAYNVQVAEGQLRETDIITDEWVAKKSKSKFYKVTRTYVNKATGYFLKSTGEYYDIKN